MATKTINAFHFSDDGSIDRFLPRPVFIPTERAPGEEWLNGPLVWAVDGKYQFSYFFPRDTPRIVLWATDRTTAHDQERWLGTPSAVAYVEADGLRQMKTATIYRYELPFETFVPTRDAWMLVSREPVSPISVERLQDLSARLAELGVDLRVSRDFSSLREVWNSTVHASGIRLRNAKTWRR